MATQDPALAAQASATAKPVLPRRSFRFAYRFILIDTLFRTVGVWAYYKGWMPAWGLWTTQLLVIPAIVGALVGYHVSKIDEKYGAGAAVQYNPDITRAAKFALLCVIVLGLLHIWFSPMFDVRYLTWTVRIALALIFLFYMAFLTVGSLGSEIEQPTFPAGDPAAHPESDLNDREIAHIESEIEQLSGRSESFSYESSLLGALAFGAFVTVAAADKAFFGGIQKFVRDVGTGLRGLMQFDLKPCHALISDMQSELTLLAAVAAVSLLASVFFIAVIVARLRFNTLLASATYWSRVACSFNAKENELEMAIVISSDPNIEQKLGPRLRVLADNVRGALQEAEASMSRLRPVIFYMVLFRGMGLLAFFCALVGSAFWIAKGFAALFFLICLAAYFYPTADRWIRDRRPSSYLRQFHRKLFHQQAKP